MLFQGRVFVQQGGNRSDPGEGLVLVGQQPEGTELAALQERRLFGHRGEDHVDFTGQGRVLGRRRARIRDLLDLDAGALEEGEQVQVVGAAVAGDIDAQLAGVRLGEGDDVIHGLVGRVLGNRDDLR